MKTRAAVIIGLAVAPLLADAEPFTYNFTGTGFFCPLDPKTGAAQCVGGIAFTGEITVNVLVPVPSGPGSLVGANDAFDSDGWVDSDFIIRWNGNSYSPERQPFMTKAHTAFVLNNHPSCNCDILDNKEGYSGTDGGRQFFSDAELTRRTTDTSWLTDLSFNLTRALAPVVSSGNPVNNRNEIIFNEFSRNGDFDGFIGLIQLTSLTPRLAAGVGIDIKPDDKPNEPNSINPRSNGVIPVAILGSAAFDAMQVNPLTVKFGPAGVLPVHVDVADVNKDRRLDVVFHFRTEDTGIQCGSNVASLLGKTFSGTSFEGSDSIRTVGCKDEKDKKK